MDRPAAARFVQERCPHLSRPIRRIVERTLRRVGAPFDPSALQEIFPLYLGAAYPLARQGWVVLLDWNLLTKVEEAKTKAHRQRATRCLQGVLALNLAHATLAHASARIHTPEAFTEAKQLAIRWGFRRELAAMERAYL